MRARDTRDNHDNAIPEGHHSRRTPFKVDEQAEKKPPHRRAQAGIPVLDYLRKQRDEKKRLAVHFTDDDEDGDTTPLAGA